MNIIDADVPDDDGTEPDDGDWVGIGEPAWERAFKLDLLVDALAETGHWKRDLAAVVIGAAYCEYYLRKLLELKLDVKRLEPSEAEPVAFAMLVRLAGSLGVLPDRLSKPLRQFARVRNRFAHNIDWRLSDHDQNELHKALDGPMRSEVERLHAEAIAKKKSVHPRALYLRLFVGTIVHELEATLRGNEREQTDLPSLLQRREPSP